MSYSRRLHLDLWAGIRGVPVFSEPGCHKVRAKTYNIGELVLRLSEKKNDKLKPKWEGPFIIDKVLTGGAYHLRNASDNRLEPNPWNAARLQRYYA